jgi:predicted permease
MSSASPRPLPASPAWYQRLFGGAGGDLRHVARQLRKSKGLTAATLATLALCIGTTTAIFSMVYALMLKPLPFEHSERLVEIYDAAVKAGLPKMPSNIVQYRDYAKNAASYEAVGLWNVNDAMVGDEGATQRLSGGIATADLFDVLRVKPVIGRFFTAENNREKADDVVVLTQSYWEAQYGEDPGVLGRSLRIDERTFKIIGVAPRAVEAVDARVKFIRPMTWPAAAENPQARYSLNSTLYGRLKAGTTVGQADAEAKMFTQRYYDAAPAPTRSFMERSGITEHAGSVLEQRVEPVRPTLYLLQGGVAFVLLIGCVNVANLLLVRSNSRLSELAVRHALGASRWIIVRLMLLESLVLTGLGALLGMGLAWLALRVINHYTAALLPQALPMALDGRVLLFAVALTVVVGIAIGLVPAVHLLKTNLTELIQRSSRGASAGRGVRALSSLLVVVQVAVALVLLTGAGLLIHSFAKALQVNPGFDPHGVVTGRVALPGAYRKTNEAALGLRERLLKQLREIPGVSSVALSFSTPFQGGLPINALTLANDPLPPGSPQPGAFRVAVSPDYADTLYLTLVEGRFLREGDDKDGRQTFVVDEAFARKFFPGQSAIGGRFTFGQRPEKDADWPTIVGVVRNVPHNGVEDRSGIPFVYQLLPGRAGGLTVFLRSERPAADLLTLIRQKIHEIDPAIAFFDGGPLTERMDLSFDSRRAVMLLLVTFAALAVFLSALGIYGVLAYDVSQRTREIGIRGAIGATREQVITLILKQGMSKTGIGLVIGLIGAALLSRTMTSLLFDLSPTDPLVYLVTAILLLLVGAMAGYLPARRAAAIDPLQALRVE